VKHFSATKLRLSFSKHQENEFTKILHFQERLQNNLQLFYKEVENGVERRNRIYLKMNKSITN